MDLTQQAARISVDVLASTVVEMLVQMETFGMQATEEMEAFEAGPEWFERVRRKIPGELAEQMERLGPQGGAEWGKLVGLAVHPSPCPDVPAFLARLSSLPPEDLWLAVAGFHIPAFREQVGEDRFRRAAAGSEDDRRMVIREGQRFEDGDPWPSPMCRLPAQEMHGLVLSVLEGWHRAVFAEDRDRIAGILARDAEAKRSMAQAAAPAALVEAATNGLELRQDPWMRRLLLVPHIAMRPWNILCAFEDLAIICYPVADDSLEPDRAAPPVAMVRLFKALGDDKRLRMLKLLTAGPASLQELADEVGLAKSSAHHHLVILRSAGLTKVGTDKDSRYTLRRDLIPDASRLLATYLEGAR